MSPGTNTLASAWGRCASHDAHLWRSETFPCKVCISIQKISVLFDPVLAALCSEGVGHSTCTEPCQQLKLQPCGVRGVELGICLFLQNRAVTEKPALLHPSLPLPLSLGRSVCAVFTAPCGRVPTVSTFPTLPGFSMARPPLAPSHFPQLTSLQTLSPLFITTTPQPSEPPLLSPCPGERATFPTRSRDPAQIASSPTPSHVGFQDSRRRSARLESAGGAWGWRVHCWCS